LLKRALDALSNVPVEQLTFDDLELMVELEEFLEGEHE
jgi:hypothetical protein